MLLVICVIVCMCAVSIYIDIYLGSVDVYQTIYRLPLMICVYSTYTKQPRALTTICQQTFIIIIFVVTIGNSIIYRRSLIYKTIIDIEISVNYLQYIHNIILSRLRADSLQLQINLITLTTIFQFSKRKCIITRHNIVQRLEGVNVNYLFYIAINIMNFTMLYYISI